MKALLVALLLLAGAACTNETVRKVETLAEAACDCGDAACADQVEEEWKALLDQGQKRGSEDDRDKIDAAFKKMRNCLAKARAGSGSEPPK